MWKNTSNNDRYSIAGNILPHGKIGIKDSEIFLGTMKIFLKKYEKSLLNKIEIIKNIQSLTKELKIELNSYS